MNMNPHEFSLNLSIHSFFSKCAVMGCMHSSEPPCAPKGYIASSKLDLDLVGLFEASIYLRKQPESSRVWVRPHVCHGNRQGHVIHYMLNKLYCIVSVGASYQP
jgi:hypothetical protein